MSPRPRNQDEDARQHASIHSATRCLMSTPCPSDGSIIYPQVHYQRSDSPPPTHRQTQARTSRERTHPSCPSSTSAWPQAASSHALRGVSDSFDSFLSSTETQKTPALQGQAHWDMQTPHQHRKKNKEQAQVPHLLGDRTRDQTETSHGPGLFLPSKPRLPSRL